MRALLRERNLALFSASSVVSMLGDWALLLALPFFVYGRTHSVLSTGGLVAAQMLPRLFISSVAGALADRWSRRLSMVGADLFRAGLLLLLLVPAAGGPLWVIYVVALLETSAAQLFVTSQGALLPTIVPGERLLAANSILATATAVVRLAGPPLGGLLYATLGLRSSVVADSVSFLLSGLVLLAIRVPASRGREARPGPTPLLRALAEGVRCVAASRVLQTLCVTLGVVMVAQGVLQTLLVPFVRDVLHLDAPGYGVVTAAQGVGALVGALGLGAIARHVTSGRVLGAGLLLAGLFLAAFTAVRPLALSAAAMFLFTVPVVIAAVWIQTYYQRHVSGDLLGRVLGLTETTSSVGILVGVVAASLLGGRTGTVTLLLASAGVLVAAGLAATAALWDASTTVPEPMATTAGVAAGGVAR